MACYLGAEDYTLAQRKAIKTNSKGSGSVLIRLEQPLHVPAERLVAAGIGKRFAVVRCALASVGWTACTEGPGFCRKALRCLRKAVAATHAE